MAAAPIRNGMWEGKGGRGGRQQLRVAERGHQKGL